MSGNIWRKIVFGLFVLGFVFSVGIPQTEAHVFNDTSPHFVKHAKEKKHRRISAAKMLAGGSAEKSTVYPSGLGGTGSVSGVVIEYSETTIGTPLANIRVDIFQGPDPNWADDETWEWVDWTIASTDGSYIFSGLTQRRYRLHIDEGQQVGSQHYIGADQYQVQVIDGALTPDIDLELRQAGLLWGYVKDSVGNPIKYAQVVSNTSYAENSHSWHNTRVDSNGRYELWLLPSPGEFYPVVVHDALTPGTKYKVYGGNSVICNEEGLDPLSYGYTYLGSATGTHTFSDIYSYYVIRAERGYLAKVDAVEGSGGFLWPQCNWGYIENWGGIDDGAVNEDFASINGRPGDGEGAYVSVNPGAGNTSLTVHIVADSRPAEPIYYEAKIAPGLYQATTDPAGVQVPDFLLDEGGKIHGRVVNENSDPVENVRVNALAWINGHIGDSDTRTDVNGYYTSPGVPVTDRAYALIDDFEVIQSGGVKYGWSRVYVGPFNITAGNTVEAPDMTILVAGMISGRVTDENGVPVVGAEIEASGYDINGYEGRSEDVYTDALGQYTLDYLAPGTYVVRSEADGFTDGLRTEVTVTSLGQVDCDLIMRSESQAAVVSGGITNYDAIAAKDSSGVLLPCNDDGDYERYGYPGVGLIAMQGAVSPTDEDYLFIEKLIIGFADPDDGYEDYFIVSASETPGDYEFTLPAGELNLSMYRHARTEDGSHVVLHDWHNLSLTAGAVFSNQDFTAQTNYGSLRGSISVPAGSDLKSERTIILVFNESDANPGLPDGFVWPDFGTTYNFAELPAGTYTVRAITEGFVTQVYEHITVSAGGTTTRNIVFTTGGTLSGTVTGDVGNVEGARVKIVETGSCTLTDFGGNYSIPGLANGNYTLEVSASGYATVTQPITISGNTTLNVTLSSQVGSIAGTVYEEDGVTSLNDAIVVAYNTLPSAGGFYRTATTVGGAYAIPELIYGDYIVAVGADGYGTAVYAGPNPDGTVTIDGTTSVYSNIDFTLTGIAPEFSVSSSVVSTGVITLLSMTFYADIPLVDSPVFSVTGSGTLTSNIISSTQFAAVYTASAGADTVVEIEITGTSSGGTGSATFSFEVSSNLQETASTNITNATGGETSMMGTQDDTSVYVPPFALAGTTDDTTAIALTIERYGDPGDSVAGTSDTPVSGVYDFTFGEDGVTIAENHTITVTMSFELPAGMTHKEFENTFEIRYFNVNSQQWVTDGISNVRINWNNYTIMFDVDHLSEFAAFAAAAGGDDGVIDDDDDDGDDDGGGCFIATAAYGTPLAQEVRILSSFRDTYLLPNALGQRLVSLYYKTSPPVARYIKNNAYLKATVRGILKPVVWLVEKFFSDETRQEETIETDKR